MKIENKNDTPLFYKITPDPLGIFRVHNKYGLIPSKSFHLVCVEFSPKDTTVYRFPLRIIFNHDSQNMKTVMINGLCTDPVIEVEGIQNEMYFPPSYVGIKTKKVHPSRLDDAMWYIIGLGVCGIAVASGIITLIATLKKI